MTQERKIASGRRFSRFLISTLIAFAGVSLTLVVGILYGILSRTMTQDFYHRLEVQQVEVSMALQDRLNLLETQLREISLNNAIRVSLMLGVRNQLLEHIEVQYPYSNGAFFMVQEKEGSTFIPELPESLMTLKPHLQKLSQEDHLQSIKFGNFRDSEFLSLFSIPIKRNEDRLGTAYVLYDISQDTHIWERLGTGSHAELLIQDKRYMVDLHTGRRRIIPENIQDLIAQGSEPPWLDLFPEVSLIQLKEFPGLFYAASSAPLHQDKTSLILILCALCAAIFLLTILVSLLIARRVSDPLESMADQSLEIAREPSSLYLREEKIKYIEFRKLAQAFNQVLRSLLEAQEELKKKSQEKLDASERRYRNLVETSPAGIFSMDKEWKILFANRSLEEITGYNQAALRSMKLWDMFHPDEQVKVHQENMINLNQGVQELYETRWIRKDSRQIWVEIRATRIQENGKQDVLVNVIDITKRKQAEEGLRRQNEYLTALHETALGLISRLEISDLLEAIVARAGALVGTPNGFIYLYDSDKDNLEVRVGLGAFSKDIGSRCEPEEGLAGKIWQTGQPLLKDDYRNWTGRLPDLRFDMLKSVMGLPLKSKDQVVGVIGLGSFKEDKKFGDAELAVFSRFAELASIALDNAKLYGAVQQELNERKRTEKALKQSEEKYRSVINQSTDCIYLVDLTSKRVIEANPALQRLLGYTHDEMLGLTIYDFIAEELDDINRNIQCTIEDNRNFIDKQQYRRKDGSLVDVEVSTSMIYYGGKDVICVVCRDMTERQKMEKEILRAQKLESVGILAGGIAHDFNNILTAVMGNLSLAKMYEKSGKKIFDILEETENACFRAKDLTHQLLTFSRGGAPVKKTVSITELIRDSATFILRGSNVLCEFSIPHDVWHIEVDEGQISQVINNLVINASQAMTEGGIIKVTAENMIEETLPSSSIKPGRYVKISIQDHGVGIPKKYLLKIFDPYFTTKQEGSGLGLTAVYSIINKHDGHITVESEQGIGTIFYIYLPASEKEILEARDLKEKLLMGKGKILVMDDEKIVRKVLGAMLKHLGYGVVFARDGIKAIEIYQKSVASKEPIDVVIMDLTIPGGMGGKEAIKRLLEVDPEAKAVVSSGYSSDPVMADFEKYGFVGVVSKPYKIEELSNALHKVIMAC